MKIREVALTEEKLTEDAVFVILSTATKDRKGILHFNLEEMGMDFGSAGLFKKK